MPRLLILLGIAVLLALVVTALLQGGEPRERALDGTREEAWQETDEGEAASEPRGAPTLKGSAHAPGGADAADPSGTQTPPEPTGPYDFVVLDFESEAPLADVEIQGDDEQRLGQTDLDGALSLEDAGVAELTFRAAKDGYVTHRGSARPGRVEVIVLQQGVTIVGRVVRADDSTPVAEAQIGAWDEDFGREVANTRTSEEGRFRLGALRPNYPVQLVVRAEGLVPHVQRELFYVSLDDFEIRVGDGGKIMGVVKTPEDKPLEGLEVRLLEDGEPIVEQRRTDSAEQSAALRLAGLRTASTWTNEKGVYEFVGVPLGRYVRPAAIVAPRYVVHAERGQGHVFRSLGETKQMDIVVRAPSSLRIRIEDETGNPIGHAQVSVQAGGSVWPLLPADAHEDGGYLLEELAVATVYVTAQLPGAPSQGAKVEMAVGMSHTVVLVFPIGRPLTGVVEDKQGQPIWKALVSWHGGGKRERAEARTDAEGRFAFSRLVAPTGTLVVTARDLPYTSRAYEAKAIEKVAPAGGALRIMLLDGTRAIGRFEELPAGSVVTSTIAGGDAYEEIDQHLKEDGRFERRGAPKGRSALFVFRTRGFPPLLVEERRPFDSEEVRDLGVLRFEASNPRQGRIVDEGGRPVHGALVGIATPWSSRTTRTDIDGDFSFPRLPDERIPVEIVADDFPVTGGTLETTSQYRRQILIIRRSTPLRVEVAFPTGVPARDLAVLLRSAAAAWKPGDPPPVEARQQVDPGEHATFHVPPGRYRLYAEVQELRLFGAQDVEVGPPQPKPVVLRLAPKRR